jgi:hypothetical protein
MNKKFLIVTLSLILVLTASFIYFTNTNKIINDENTLLINHVVEVEKGLVLTQLRRNSFDDFKNKTGSFFHSDYKDSFFDEIGKRYNEGGGIAASTLLPLYQYISKVYSSKDGALKYIYVKIPDKHIIGQAADIFMFKKEDNEWKIRVIKYYVLSDDMKRPEKDVERFTNHDGTPIEYEYIKILD